jgi:hypothetical protein
MTKGSALCALPRKVMVHVGQQVQVALCYCSESDLAPPPQLVGNLASVYNICILKHMNPAFRLWFHATIFLASSLSGNFMCKQASAGGGGTAYALRNHVLPYNIIHRQLII